MEDDGSPRRVFLVICFTWKSGTFNLMMMGDEDAAAMGVDVKNFRRWMFVVCAIIVASLVSVTGIIGFVGLMVPHIRTLSFRNQ
ncbi:MAG: iron chelate uptake ABC transporter family permease subunit [Lachnospiraceae bacterium]